jgi:hypothetical protein
VTPYWKRRVEGHVFSDWLSLAFGLILVGLIGFRLLQPRPHDRWDYFTMAAWTFIVLTMGWRLFRRRGQKIGEGNQPGPRP